MLEPAPDIHSKPAAAKYGTVEWCCALEFCVVHSGQARPNVHRCTKCDLKMHQVCGIADVNIEDGVICFVCAGKSVELSEEKM
jgi:hypothetical protein